MPKKPSPKSATAGAASAAARTWARARELILAGRVADYPYAQRVGALIEEHALAGSVDVVEDLTDVDMPDVMAAADVVTQPSLEEGLGLAAIEAMSWSRPVVACDVVGLEEIFTHEVDGLLVPAKDPERLSEALLRLLLDPGLAARLGAAKRGRHQLRYVAFAVLARARVTGVLTE